MRVLFVSGVLAIALGQVLEAGADSWIEVPLPPPSGLHCLMRLMASWQCHTFIVECNRATRKECQILRGVYACRVRNSSAYCPCVMSQ